MRPSPKLGQKGEAHLFTKTNWDKGPNYERTLDDWFSRFIRLRNADEFGFIKCITCGRRVHWKKAHNGHYVKRGHQGTRYHEQNCGEQCEFCNTKRNGEEQAHRLHINFTYGEGTAEFLKLKGKAAFTMTKEEYEEKINHYKEIVKSNPLYLEASK